MTHVILGHCCKDASCVRVCPQNCIHPTPGEPGFEAAETLHIDPRSCIDCTACVDACPASAIKPEHLLTLTETPSRQRNRDYYQRTAVAPPVTHPARFGNPLGTSHSRFRIAVVGSGPAALYTVRELLQRSSSVRVTVFEKDDRIGGLLRRGVAADQQGVREMIRLFELPFGDDRVEIVCGTEIGVDVSIAELRMRYDAVVLACGASQPRAIGLTGDMMRTGGVHQALDILTGSPADANAPTVSGPRCVIVGAGNVALDVVRRLAQRSLRPPATRPVREVTVLSRSGPDRVAFTLSAFHELLHLETVELVVDSTGAQPNAGSGGELGRGLSALPAADPTDVDRLRVVLSFGRAVTDIRSFGPQQLSVITDSGRSFPADSVICAAGFSTAQIRGIPLDANGIVPNHRGRIVSPATGEPLDRLYVVGWAKRGATGGVGDNRTCAAETVAELAADLTAATV
ncbi:FAD-dependent oxidoreductase [Nocardia alni]|uniref:FAD-dependent oxidoreductase n=1 Tax=Nocardia alni TaxID=2815723 RepID=UPI001C2153B5|nr:FAD-dependent oxidoreductase [Nocardia alni]